MIESAIGDNNVLNNVGKIEKFIVMKLREMIDDWAVFPNYHCIYIEHEEESDVDE